MQVLVVGATGATGSLLVTQLLDNNHKVRVLVRSRDRLPNTILTHQNLEIVEAGISSMSENEMMTLIIGCDAVASCLGHNLSLKGMYGKPRRLVTDAVHSLCEAIVKNQPSEPVRFVLMSSSGVRNRDLPEPISFGQKIIVGLLRILVPPHPDNEQAAEYLRLKIGQDHKFVEWVAVRPDGLVNAEEVTPYRAFPSPIRSAIFDAGKISRISVAHFMNTLLTHGETWGKWKGKMPVLYDATYV